MPMARGTFLTLSSSSRPQCDGITLSAQYLRDIASVEVLPENRDGADKTWVLTLAEELMRLHRNVARMR